MTSNCYLGNPNANIIQDCCRSLLHLTISGFRTIFKARTGGRRRWVVCLTLVFCLSSAIDSGAASVNYLFYRRQYRVTNTHMASLKNMYNWLMLVAQVHKNLSSLSPSPKPRRSN